jgi:hypothetical protein
LKVGTTVLNIWFNDPEWRKSVMVGWAPWYGCCPIPTLSARLERAYKNLEKEINRAFP